MAERFQLLRRLMFTFTIILSLLPFCYGECNYLRAKGGCACVGSDITLECAVNGTGLTVWKVNRDECLTLAHSDFPTSTMSCENGQVMGSGNSTVDSCYTSTVTVDMSEDLVGANVECVLDDGIETQIDNITLSIEAQRTFLIPSNVHHVMNNGEKLAFSWVPVSIINCPNVRYNFNATEGCGECSISASDFVIKCVTATMELTLCTLCVLVSDMCGNVIGTNCLETIDAIAVTSMEPSHDLNLPGIIGGTVAGVIFIIGVVIVTVYVLFKMGNQHARSSKEQSEIIVDLIHIRKLDVEETVFTKSCGSGSKQPPTEEHKTDQKEKAGLEKKCSVITDGLEFAELGETTNIVLQMDSDEDISQLISAGLFGPLVNIECDVVRLKERKYQISYTPKARGNFKLDIKINNMHVPGSPFNVSVSLPLQKLGDQTINMLKLCDVDMPSGLAVNKQGVIIVAEEGSHCISFFNSSGGKLKKSVGLQGLNSRGLRKINARGVAIMDDGNILVVDGGNHCILVFTSDGTFFKPVGEEGTNDLQFKDPMGVAVHPVTQKVFVADHSNHRIQILNPNLTFDTQFGCYGNCNGQFDKPWDIAFDTVGNVYVVDSGNHRVQVFSAEMEYIMYIRKFGRQGTSEGELSWPSYIHIDGQHVYLAEDGNHRVSIFTTEGEFVKSFGRYGQSELGHFCVPHGIAVDKNGNVYVSDHHNHRIQVF